MTPHLVNLPSNAPSAQDFTFLKINSRQKPQLYAREWDEVAIAHWRRYRWPALKKKGTAGAPLDGVSR
jgi:hypothetical protein